MTTCNRCGQQIEIRYISGVPTPLHFEGSCIDSETGWSDSGYAESGDSECRLTHCPECGAEVYFIQHNGGSVWIDPPLGWPWYKHPCMDDNLAKNPQGSRQAMVDDADDNSSESVIGVVKSCQVSTNRRASCLTVIVGESSIWGLIVERDFRSAVGELIIISLRPFRFRGLIKPALQSPLLGATTPQGNYTQSSKLMRCPECKSVADRSQFLGHMSYVHGLKAR